MENENIVNEPQKPSSRGKKIAAGVVFAIIAITLALWLAKDYIIPKQITVIINTLEETREITAEVKAHTVGDALEKLGIPISDIDQILPFLSETLTKDATINITKRLETLAEIDGKKQRFLMIPGTVEENLEYNDIEYDDNDIVKPKLTKDIKCTTKIQVKDVKKVVKKKEITVENESYIMLDPSIASGSLVEVAGNDGVALYTYTYTYVNGKKTDTKKKFKKWLVKPVDHVIKLGTSLTGESGRVAIKRSFISNTTAYYCGKKARGSTGQRCHYGTCAVDPKVIPYGSRLWVQGYGFAYANDCGGAIKGTKLDLYMRSTKECYRWGRRHVRAYVLG